MAANPWQVGANFLKRGSRSGIRTGSNPFKSNTFNAFKQSYARGGRSSFVKPGQARFTAGPTSITDNALGNRAKGEAPGMRGAFQRRVRGDLDPLALRNMRRSGKASERARSFAYRRPLTTMAIGGAMIGPAINGGSSGNGRTVSRRNQNSFAVRRMRSGQQSSGVAGIAANSLGGLA